MKAPGFSRIVLCFSAVGATVGVVILFLALAVPAFPIWLGNIVLAVCPPALMLMATEGCGGLLSWCSLQVVLLMVLSNAVFYGLFGVVVLSVLSVVGRLHSRGAA